jgi:F-box and leucine-rich repeat protein 10/11
MVVRLQFVQDLDLIEKVWPKNLRHMFPKVTLHCIKSGSCRYIDFHIDFGSSSIFYHILHGRKTFLFVDPTEENLAKYEAWCGDPDQHINFFGDQVECLRMDLEAGQTMICCKET